MIKTGKGIAKHRRLILLVSILLLLPSVWGMLHMRTNYDLLTYLPESLDTVKGQNILVDEYGIGAFSMIVVENKDMEQVSRIEQDIEAIPHVKNVLWYDDLADISVPAEMIPEELREKFFRGDATMMIALLDDSTSSDASLEAVEKIRETVDQDCSVGGMTAILNDLKALADREVPVYVTVAVGLSLAAMLLLTDSFLVPFLFLLDIGFAIAYNLGTNFMFGEISYITKAVAAVLQLGVTMDYSIFLLGSYRENLLLTPDDREEAMGRAIAATFRSVIGSSVTTVAGFIALCFMTFTLGLDMGLVMAKGVLFGVASCLLILPALILTFDGLIRKTTHRPLIRSVEKASDFITGHYRLWLIVFAALLVPAVYGSTHAGVYYDMSASLPDELASKQAQKKLEDVFDVSTMHMLLMEEDMPEEDRKAMLREISKVDGVNTCIGLDTLRGDAVPESVLPSGVRDMLQGGGYELALVSTGYYTGSDEVNAQIDEILSIIRRYGNHAMLIGEAPLTHDLVDVTNIDFRNVNAASILIIFVIIALVFRSLGLPVILELVIESAIMINMGIPYFTGTKLAFVTSIILGTVQLGSTVDYAILMTGRYQKERQAGCGKREAVRIAHRSCMLSIITSGVSFFAATFGVAVYSKIEIIRSICLLLSRGALISTAVVLFVLPGMFLLLDGVIVRTSWRFLGKSSTEAGRTPAVSRT